MKIVALVLALAASLWAGSSHYFPPPDAKGGWRTLKTDTDIRKTAGIDPAKLDEAFEYTKNTSQHGGLLVVRHGYLVYEKYFGRGNLQSHSRARLLRKGFHKHRRRHHAQREGRTDSRRPRSKGLYSAIHAGLDLPARRSEKGGYQAGPVARHVGGDSRRESRLCPRRKANVGFTECRWPYRDHRSGCSS